MPRRPLPQRVSPVQMLRALRDRPGLVALLGDWVGGDAVVGIHPDRTLRPEEDPFAALSSDGAPRGSEGAATAPLGHESATAATHPGNATTQRTADSTAAQPESFTAPPTAGTDARFGGGWIGYLGYQLSRRLESLPPAPARSGALPEHHLAHYDHVLVHDDAADRWFCESLPGADPERVEGTLALVERALAGGPAASSAGEAPAPRPYRCEPFEAAVTGAAHAEAVRRALGHIRDGDIFQANICRELTAGFHGDPLDLFCAGYERLRPRFAAFLRVPGGAVASLSPELYLRRTGDAVLTSPIKGTAPADADPRELHASAKNRAENVMIVDLMRNDLSRACVPGSVRTPAEPRVEPHTGVHHLVADVHGTLRPELDDAALVRATFPPGSCTGAPKIRATEIINELETTARGVYTGGIGCVSPVAGLVVNVAIRTFEFSGSTVRLGVGGGIVADSDPDEEAFETLVKAAPLLDAVGASFGGGLAREWREHAHREGAGVATPECVRRAEGGSASSSESPAGPGTASAWPVATGRPEVSRGVFTTILVRNGRAEQLEQHLARLGESVRACWGGELPRDLGTRITRRAAGLDGPHRLRVTAVPEVGRVRMEFTAAPLNPPGAREPQEPWELVPVVVPGGWGCHKWADRRALEALPGPWSPVCDPLLTDRDGTLLETGRANIFLVLDGAVVTPPADGRILPGVMRARVLERLAAAGCEVHERVLTLGECADATEVFVTNALRGARPVGSVRGVGRWEPGPVTARVQRLLTTLR